MHAVAAERGRQLPKRRRSFHKLRSTNTHPLFRHLEVEHVRRIEVPQERGVVQPAPLRDGLSVTAELFWFRGSRETGKRNRGERTRRGKGKCGNQLTEREESCRRFPGNFTPLRGNLRALHRRSVSAYRWNHTSHLVLGRIQFRYSHVLAATTRAPPTFRSPKT